MSIKKMTSQTELKLLARFFTSECSADEYERVEKWSELDPKNKKLLDLLKSVWHKEKKPTRKSDVNGDWMRVAERAGIIQELKDPVIKETPVKKVKQRRSSLIFLKDYRRTLKYAAIFILIILLPFIWKTIKPSFMIQQTLELEEILVENGKQKKLTLNDGTQVILDAGSVFRYLKKFDGETRNVFLKGEGYFEVSPDKEKPFVVNANHAVIKVLGTKFNVRAWQHAQKVKVAVVEGKVTLSPKKATPETTVLISKGEESVFPKNGQPSKPQKGDINNHLGWITRDVVFNNMQLQEILYQLERWYNIRFILDENISASNHLTVHIEDRPIEVILELITDLAGLKYKYEGHTVFLYSKDEK